MVLEARAPQTLVELLGVASLDLVGEQAVEELGVGEVVVDGLAGAQLEALQDAGEAELLEQREDLVSEAQRVSEISCTALAAVVHE